MPALQLNHPFVKVAEPQKNSRKISFNCTRTEFIRRVLVFEFEKIKQIKFNQFGLRGREFTSWFRIAFYIRENLGERTLQNQIWCAFPTRTNGPWRLLLIYRVRLAGGAAGAGLNLHWNRICFHVVVAAVKVRSDFSDLSGAHTVIR